MGSRFCLESLFRIPLSVVSNPGQSDLKSMASHTQAPTQCIQLASPPFSRSDPTSRTSSFLFGWFISWPTCLNPIGPMFRSFIPKTASVAPPTIPPPPVFSTSPAGFSCELRPGFVPPDQVEAPFGAAALQPDPAEEPMRGFARIRARRGAVGAAGGGGGRGDLEAVKVWLA